MSDLSRLTPQDPRKVWPNEAHEFTPWLLKNADALSEVLGIDVELNEAEHSVGGFWLDLIGRDLTNNCVLIVENQLTSTDHGHLGQLVTYAAGTDAGTIVWMAPEFREEHRQALDWLNNLAGEGVRLFGIEIGVVTIDDSKPAPLFKLKAQPNDWHAFAANAAKAASQAGGKGEKYLQFWTRFLERVHVERPGWTKAKKAGVVNWLEMPSSIRGCTYPVSFAAGGKLRAELYIDTGNEDENLKILDDFKAQQTEIEAEFGDPLSWEDLPGKRACRIAVYTDGDANNVELFDQYIDWFFDVGMRLRTALEHGAAAM